jgi:hypothetical protein
MAPQGVQNFYYSRTLPARSVAIAQIEVPALTPAQLTDVNNTVYDAGALSVWKSTSSLTGPADFLAPALGAAVQISSVQMYYVGNQFFELTNITAIDGITPLFYKHQLPQGSTHIQILDLQGNTVTTTTLLSSGGILYHSLDGAAYRVQFINNQGLLIQQVLRYGHVIALSTTAPMPGCYTLIGPLMTLSDTGVYFIRFTQANGFQVMPMYTGLPNTPWYPRVRFGLKPPPAEWARQPFLPSAPWLSASYVAGTVLDTHMIQFERPNIYDDPSHLPDILIFDKNNVFKFALDGYVQTSPTQIDDPPYLKGYIYNWQRGKIVSIDPTNARVDVDVELDPTDVVWGFYSYAEYDLIYTNFDCNPFTNPIAKNSILQLYVKFSGGDPTQNVYHQLLDASGNPIAGQTNDPTPGTGTSVIFAEVVVGSSISEANFTLIDARVRGGGLAPKYQTIPQAVNFWDIGYWDGKPYPFAGALAIYLPYSILSSLSRTDVQGRIGAVLPMGTIAVIRYIDATGNEYV